MPTTAITAGVALTPAGMRNPRSIMTRSMVTSRTLTTTDPTDNTPKSTRDQRNRSSVTLDTVAGYPRRQRGRPVPAQTHCHAADGRCRAGVGSPPGRACRIRISLYDLCVVSDEQIRKWADEADAGYDVAELKRRGRGRPGRGAEPAQVVAVRLTAEELEALDAAAKRHDLSRSEAIRAALAHFAA
ncbi:hypothetical protein SDC9_175677 [bioreactor metagenome]|uniref:Ribbon-helix-helix protein CopG domain-containing protein n=1 Tax=bioreactor metagenome TaxID=1076179 RepID=A0A645GPX2_9ZZZZ